MMTSAAVRFELLSTVHTSPVSFVDGVEARRRVARGNDAARPSVQVTLDVQREGGVSIKGPRGGVFVMYNCARLHTLFDSYERGVENGETRAPPPSKRSRVPGRRELSESALLSLRRRLPGNPRRLPARLLGSEGRGTAPFFIFFFSKRSFVTLGGERRRVPADRGSGFCCSTT